MAFSDQVKLQRYQFAGGQCECTRLTCLHFGRCTAHLLQPVQRQALTARDLSRVLFGQEPAYSYPGFEFHHRLSQAANGPDTLLNAEFLCLACHQKTRSFGTNLSRNY